MKFKRSSLMTKIIVIIPVIAATVTLVTLQTQLAEKEKSAATLTTQVEVAKQENLRLQDAIEKAGTDEGVKTIARDKLGMVEDGEIIFYDIGS
ncbi:MAG: septum formation initiator family protein [Oscillospiraceae bacterium]|nr:septum formation initiator family protein [Oscillospiraceae bacterium]